MGTGSNATVVQQAPHASLSPRFRRLPPALLSDVLPIRRALSERSELARPPLCCVRPILIRRVGRQWFWVLLPKQKDLVCRGETR